MIVIIIINATPKQSKSRKKIQSRGCARGVGLPAGLIRLHRTYDAPRVYCLRILPELNCQIYYGTLIFRQFRHIIVKTKKKFKKNVYVQKWSDILSLTASFQNGLTNLADFQFCSVRDCQDEVFTNETVGNFLKSPFWETL